MVSLREIRVYAFGALPPPLRAHPGNAQLRIKTALVCMHMLALQYLADMSISVRYGR